MTRRNYKRSEVLEGFMMAASELYLTKLNDLTRKLNDDINGPYTDTLKKVFDDETTSIKRYERGINHLEGVLIHLGSLSEHVNQYVYTASGKKFRIWLGLTMNQAADEILDLAKQKGIKISVKKISIHSDISNIENGKRSFSRDCKTTGKFYGLYIQWLQNRGYNPNNDYAGVQIERKEAYFKTRKELIENLILDGEDIKNIANQIGVSTKRMDQHIKKEGLHELWKEARENKRDED